MRELDPARVRRIAVLRANGLGDFLFATPALRALAARFPEAEITWFGQPEIVAFAEGRYPYLHRAEVVPFFPTIRRRPSGPFHYDPATWPTDQPLRQAVRATREFFERHQRAPFDLAIQMQGGGAQSNPFVRMLGARRTIGLKGPNVRCPLDLNLTYQFYHPEEARYLELVELLGAQPDELPRLEAPERPDDRERLRLVWPEVENGGFVVIHPSVSDPRRRWPIDRFAALAEHVWRVHRRTIVATGAVSERGCVRELQAAVNCPVTDLSGQIDLGAFAALLRRADLVVGNDSGTANLAVAVDAPSVVIYWCGNAITAGHFRRTRLRPVISFTDRCPRCGGERDRPLPSCKHDVSFVADAPLSEAIAQADDLLATPSLRAAPREALAI